MQKIILLVCLLFSMVATAQNSPKGLSLNEQAPDFSSADQYGENISLSNELKKGSVVLVFYRGQWCPYCNRALKQLEDSLSFIKEKGASVITITPEKPAYITQTISKTKASYSILHDEGLSIMKKYDVAFQVDEKTIEAYKKYGIHFNEVNGEANGANLPVPAVYVINKQGKIVYRYFDKDYRKRSSIREILAHL